MSNTDNIYNILNNFNKIAKDAPAPVAATTPKAKTKLQESMEQVVNEKYMGFKKTVAAGKKLNEKAANPYAVGMAVAKKKAGITAKPAHDLPKKVVKKAHEIAKKIDEGQDATTYTVAYKDPKKPGKSRSTQVKATSAAEAKAAFQKWDTTNRFTYLGSRPDVDKVYEELDPEHVEYLKRQADISRSTGLAVGDRVTLKDRPGFEGEIVHDWGGGDFTISGSGGGMSQSKNHRANARLIQKIKEDHGPENPDAPVNYGEYDREGDMAKDDLYTIDSAAEELYSILQADENLPEWVQSKITKAVDYIDTARDYMKAQSYGQGVAEGSGDPQITPRMKTQYGTVVSVDGDKVTVRASNGELTTVNIRDIDQAMAEGDDDKFRAADKVEELVRYYKLFDKRGWTDLFAKLAGRKLQGVPEISREMEYASKFLDLLDSIRMRSDYRGQQDPKKDQELVDLSNQWLDLFNKATSEYKAMSGQGMAEGSSENKYSNLSNRGVNRGINRAGDDFNRMMDLDQAESPHYKTQHQQNTKQRLKTKPMVGPKGVLPEQDVTEGMPTSSLTSRYMDDPNHPSYKSATSPKKEKTLQDILKDNDFAALQIWAHNNSNNPLVKGASAAGDAAANNIKQQLGLAGKMSYEIPAGVMMDKIHPVTTKAMFDYLRTHAQQGVAEGMVKGEYGRVLDALQLYYPRLSMDELNVPGYHKVVADKAKVPVEYAAQVINDFTRDNDPNEFDDFDDDKQGMSEARFPTVADAQKRAEQEKGTGKFTSKKSPDHPSGTIYTRKYNPKSGETDNTENVSAEKRRRGPPKKSAFEDMSTIDKMIAESFGELFESTSRPINDPVSKAAPTAPGVGSGIRVTPMPALATPKPATTAKPTPGMGSIQGGVWTAKPPKAGEPGVPVPQGIDEGPLLDKIGTGIGKAAGSIVGGAANFGQAIKKGYQAGKSGDDDERAAASAAADTAATRSMGQMAPDRPSAPSQGMDPGTPQPQPTAFDPAPVARPDLDEADAEMEGMRKLAGLKGGQKKLDRDQDGELTRNDFRMLRKGLEEGGRADYEEIQKKIQWLQGAPNYLSPDEAKETVYYTKDTDPVWDGYRDDADEVGENLEVRANPAGASSAEQAKKIGAQFPQQNGKEPNLAYKIGEDEVEENLIVVPNLSGAGSVAAAKKLGAMMPAKPGEKDPISTNEEDMEEGNVITKAMADKTIPVGAPIPDTNLKKTKHLDTMAEGDAALNQMRRIAGLKECGMSPISGMAADMEKQQGSMNISTNQSSDGTKSVTITAAGDAASDLMQMLKLAGMGGGAAPAAAAEPEIVVVAQDGEETMEEEKDPRYQASTTPDEQVAPVQALTKGGNGDVAGQEKTMKPGGYQFGDNNLAMQESLSTQLMKEYNSIKVKK